MGGGGGEDQEAIGIAYDTIDGVHIHVRRTVLFYAEYFVYFGGI